MKKIYLLLLSIVLTMTMLIAGCKKGEELPIQEPIDYTAIKKGELNDLDRLTDSIFATYGVRVFYEFNPRIIDPTTFYVPARYEKAKMYTKYVVEKSWLAPLKANFPRFLNEQKPIEFLIVGTYVHFNSISSGTAAGAGLNAQYYRLGMGGADVMAYTKASIRAHMCTLFHEHAHQMDQKYGRGYAFDRVSQGTYYQLNYTSRTEAQAQADGFFNAYAGFAPEEDFATAVEYMIKLPKSQILTIVAKNPKLATKYQMVYKMYLDMGIDLHQMYEILNTTVNSLPL